MFTRVIVPVDGSDFSWRALGPAAALAQQTDAVLEVLQVVTLPDDAQPAEQIVREQLGETGIDAEMLARVQVVIETMGDNVASTIAQRAVDNEGSIVVMSSVGRGRSAALIGSIAEELLGLLFGPIMVVGPDARIDRPDFRGSLVVTVDGSTTSESALPLAAAWGIGLEATPWIALVLDPDAGTASDIDDSSYPNRLAQRLSAESNHAVEFEVLRDNNPAHSVAEFAETNDASLIITSTHGRTGLARIRAGSVAMNIVRRAPCPVVLNRPPDLSG